MHGHAVTTYLFTDIEGSTRLWDTEPERMRAALARHDALTRDAVTAHGGRVVKTTGDGFHAVFDDPLAAVNATVQLQLRLQDGGADGELRLRVRAGLHAGIDERRDNDFFGPAVNRAARIMSAAHGGQILLSQAVVDLIADRLPSGMDLRALGRVRLRNLSDSESVFQVMHPALRENFPALRSLESTPNNLPRQITSFIGREAALTEVRKLLANTRLLTLLGVGGLGKTRLSLQLAAEVLDDYPDGVWFVELAALTDEALVPQAVASVLGVKEEAGRPVVDALEKFGMQRTLLIVLDNCEHLVSACARLAKRLLQSAPGLKILTSSREALHVQGETTYAVPALAVPDVPPLTLATLTEYEAIRLFVDRATAAQPGFQLTEQNAPAVTGICRRLDGMPLAIELAAARIRALSAEAIAERLGDRFRLLTHGDRTALPRQQTLRALIDWSYDLLTEHERELFRRLAVFAGGWALDGAEAVGAGGGLQPDDVLPLLSHLVEKSLVALDAGGGRYRMLDTVREYACQRLTETHEAAATQARHLVYYSALADDVRPALTGPEQGRAMARLDLERENLFAAHRFCDHAENGAAIGLKFIRALQTYWLNRGLLGLGLQMTQEALARPAAQPRNLLRCRGLSGAGQLALFMGAYGDAQRFLEESLAIARELEDPTRVAAVLQPLGMAALGQGNFTTARARLDEALALAHTMSNDRETAAALTAMAQLRRVEGVLDDAESLNMRAIEIFRRLGDRESIATGQLNLAMVAIGRGDAVVAHEMLIQGMTIAQEIGSRMTGQSAIEVSAGLAAMLRQWPQAARLFGAAEAQAAQTGIRRDAADEAFLAPLMARGREALGAEAFAAAERAGRSLPFETAVAHARAWVESASGDGPGGFLIREGTSPSTHSPGAAALARITDHSPPPDRG